MKKILSTLNLLLILTAVNLSISFAFAQAEETTSDKPTTPKSTIMIKISTSKGDIELELDAEKAPKTVENFLSYIKSGHYDGTIFHRVIPNFMIQGGGFSEGMVQKPTQDPIPNEANNGLKNDKYTIAMARTNAPHSATAQFFINTKDNDFLNFSSETQSGWGYAVFGKVTKGQDIVDAIEAVTTEQVGPHGDVPAEEITINSATIVE